MLMRLVSMRNASANAMRRSTSVPSTAAGSGRPNGRSWAALARSGRLLGRVVTDGEDEVELGRAGPGELGPALERKPLTSKVSLRSRSSV